MLGTEVMVMMPVSTATPRSPVPCVPAEGRSHSKGLTHTCTEKQRRGLTVSSGTGWLPEGREPGLLLPKPHRRGACDVF